MSASPAGGPPVPRWRAWWSAARPKTLSAGLVPVLIGAALAARDGAFHPLAVWLAAIGAAAIQIATNLHNDYSDFVRGTDNASRLGPARAAQMGWLTVADLRRGTVVAFAVAVAAGIGLVQRGGWPIVAIGLSSVLAGLAYTGGPMPLAYLGIADLFVFVFFGLVAVAGTYFASALTWSADALIAGAAVGFFSTAILVVNNLRDHVGDAASGKKTLVVRFGLGFGRAEYVVCLLGGFGAFAWLALHDASLWVTLAGAPVALLCASRVLRLEGAALGPWLGRTAALLALEGALFVGGVWW